MISCQGELEAIDPTSAIGSCSRGRSSRRPRERRYPAFVYLGAKAFDNMDGFRRFLGFEPNTKLAVLIFGLFHGFGLATKLQELDLSKNGLVTNIVSFNVGVEIGQVLALTAVLIVLSVWRTRRGFLRHAFATNAVLMTAGFVLVGYQVAGYFVAQKAGA